MMVSTWGEKPSPTSGSWGEPGAAVAANAPAGVELPQDQLPCAPLTVLSRRVPGLPVQAAAA